MAATNETRFNRHFTSLCSIQGLYYLVTGVWPLVSIRSFKAGTGERGKTDHLVTGLESDHWLIMTVGLLITAIALTLLVAAYRKTHAIEIAILAISVAVGLTAIDVVYTSRGVISPIYWVDAALEVPLFLTWLIALNCRRIGRQVMADQPL